MGAMGSSMRRTSEKGGWWQIRLASGVTVNVKEANFERRDPLETEVEPQAEEGGEEQEEREAVD